MIFSTRTCEARRSSAATPQHTSRSVTTPTNLSGSVSLTTGYAAAAYIRHRLRGVCRRILRGTARRHFDRFHHIAATTHFLFFLLDLRNDSYRATQYTMVLGGFQVHRHRICAVNVG